MQPAATPTEDVLDFHAFLTEPYPCQNCRHAARCKASLEACAAFSSYVAHAGELRWRAAPRQPTRALFETIFAEHHPATAQTPKRPHGNWDLDLSNCHYALLLQLAAVVGVDVPAVRWYLDDKEAVRAGLAARVGISKDEAKSCLIALIYGARFTVWEGADIPKLLGRARARRLYADPQFRALKADVTRARKAILRAALRGPIVLSSVSGSLRVAEIRKLKELRLFNAVGSSITVLDRESHRRSKRRSPAALLAHILLGLEAKIMRMIVDAYSDDVLLLMHDGLVSRSELPVREIEERIRQRTGLGMTLEQERIEVPEELGDLGKLLERKSLRDLGKAEDLAHYGPPALVGGSPGLAPVVPVAGAVWWAEPPFGLGRRVC